MNVVTVDVDRQVRAPVDTSRRTVLSALSALGFSIERSDAASMRATRGSTWFGGVRPDKRPMSVDATVVADGDRTAIHLHLAGTGQASGVSQFMALFRTVQETVDGWLRALDPGVRTAPLPRPEVHFAQGAATRGVAAAARQVGATHLAERLHTEPWVWVVTPDAAAALSMNDAHMCLAIASMIASAPGSLSPAMLRQLNRVTMALQRGVENAAPPAVRVVIDAVDKKVLELLYRQSLIRQGLPVREIHRCRDCALEKVVNPDYQGQARRNRRISDLMGVVGITLGSNPQMFALAGRLFNMKMLAPPEFVCARCQGTGADVALATICPQCHAIRREALLLVCPTEGCGYDFRKRAADASPWQRVAAEPVGPPPGWYPDPSGRHQLRWFDGAWSSHAADWGAVVEDELPAR